MTLFPEIEKENKQKRKADRERKQQVTNHIIENSEMWRPSNGTEGAIFESNFCAECSNDNPDKEKFCPIIFELMQGETEKVRLYTHNNKSEVVCLGDSNLNSDEFEKDMG